MTRVDGARPRYAGAMGRDQILLLNMCGRGDKDIFSVMDALGGR